MEKQLSLFDDVQPKGTAPKAPQLEMSAEALIEWKTRIYTHQQSVRESAAPQQLALFDLAPAHCDPNEIDPFSLPPVAMSFYRMPAEAEDSPCIYFIIDSAMSLLLYVGETGRNPQLRWKGTHDAKDYIHQYILLHRKYKLDVAVNAAFWWGAPAKRKPRQELEQALIQKWRSPFNKEMWACGQPFKAFGK